MSARGYVYREFFIPDYMAEGLDLWIERGNERAQVDH